MSVVSSRVNSVSSILQGPGVREKFIKQSNRVFFKLPNDIKSVLCNFETSNEYLKDYNKLIHLLREGAVRDSDFAEFLVEARQCVSILSTKHESFIQVLLKIQWTDRSPEVITNYKLFLQDLVCMQTHYTTTVINHLVQLFKPVEDNNVEHEVGKFEDEDIKRLNHIHDILNKILQVVPMSNKVLLQSVYVQFPYVVYGTYTHEVYIYALLQVLNYAPQLRSDILHQIINRLVMLDVNIPRKKVDNDKKDDLTDCIDETDDNQTDDNDVDEKNVNSTARALDTCMELFLKYMHEFCFENGVLKAESMKMLYFDVLRIFETIILPTYASQYVQYIAFYICSFKVVVVETFTNWLWSKVVDPNAPSVIRQSAVYYISSLLASASFVPFGLIKLTMFKLASWICDYITIQECLDHIDDMKLHVVFYSVCQAFFHLFITRHKEFLEEKNGILFLQELDITKIVNCKLNPLKICDKKIVHNFADITSTYQLAYCYAVIENNERNQLPIFGIKTHSPFLISKFFPFESYTLQYSGQRILPLFHSNIVNAP